LLFDPVKRSGLRPGIVVMQRAARHCAPDGGRRATARGARRSRDCD
jgi:hypothetical protein